jgi:hypothetical protein
LGCDGGTARKKTSPEGAGDMIAQHAAEGGVLGKVGKRFESPGDDTGSHTDSLALGFWIAKLFRNALVRDYLIQLERSATRNFKLETRNSS